MIGATANTGSLSVVVHGMSTALSTTMTAILAYLFFGYFYLRVIDIQAAAGQRMAGGLTDTDVARFVAIADQMTDALHLGDGAALDG